MFAASWRNGRRHHTLAHASPAQLGAPAKHRAHEAKRTEVRLSPRPSGSTAQLRHGHSVVNWFGVSIRQHTPTCKRAVFVSSLSPAHEPATGAAESGAACDSAARCPCYCAMRSRHAPQRSSTPASTASSGDHRTSLCVMYADGSNVSSVSSGMASPGRKVCSCALADAAGGASSVAISLQSNGPMRTRNEAEPGRAQPTPRPCLGSTVTHIRNAAVCTTLRALSPLHRCTAGQHGAIAPWWRPYLVQ